MKPADVMNDDLLRQMANTAFEVMNWARREGMKRDQQVEQVVAGFKADLDAARALPTEPPNE